MTTYKRERETKEQRPLMHHDNIKIQSKLWARTSCLFGFSVLSILIGCAALAISILLLLQTFEVAGLENARVADLEMRVRYLERLTENMAPQQKDFAEEPADVMGAPPPAPPQPPPPAPPSTAPHIPAPPQSKVLPEEGAPKPEVLPPTEDEEDATLGGMDDNERARPPHIVPIDDDEDSYPLFEGSGDDCPPNPPRPHCPVTLRLCMTKERCPAYVCCK